MKIKSAASIAILLVAAGVVDDTWPAQASPSAQKTVSRGKASPLITKQQYLIFIRAIKKEEAGERLGAIDAYTELLRISPKTGLYYARRAYLRADLDDEDGAKQDCQSAIDCPADDASIYYKVGRTKALLGDSVGAITVCSAGLKQ